MKRNETERKQVGKGKLIEWLGYIVPARDRLDSVNVK